MAGHVCSICRTATTGPNADLSGDVTIGTAAHICAAAEGGPRFDPTMSSEERSAAENGIWLCRNHGDLIDDDPDNFTVERLRALKSRAELVALNKVLNGVPDGPRPAAPSTGLRAAAQADLDVYRRMPRWPKSGVALTLKIAGVEDTVTTTGLASAAQRLDDLVLVAGPGMGKTTTLLQIADSVLANGHGVPIFVALADWATEARAILTSIVTRPAWRDQGEVALRSAAKAGEVVLLLDGWNELDPPARERARVEIETLKAELPALALVVSTRRQSLDVRIGGARVEVLPLSEAQQMDIARALGGDEGAGRLDRAWRTPRVRDLVAVPLYLAALMALPAGAPFPETREEVFRRFVEAHEAEPGRAAKLERDALGFHRNFLCELAFAGLAASSPVITDNDARAAIARTAAALANDGQVEARPEPRHVLDALIDNHVLVRAGDGSGIAFQHQQFQEWFASHEIERRMRDALAKGRAHQALQKDILDQPGWLDTILFAIERMARDTRDDQRAAHQAILAAFAVDPMLAAEMIRRGTDEVWAPISAGVQAMVAGWHNPGTNDRAARFMIESGRPEFLDLLWPLITNANDQISLKALRNCRRFPITLLGQGAHARVAGLADGPRETFLHEIAMHGDVDGLDFVVSVAKSDPSLDVQSVVADSLTFRHADRHLAELLQCASDELFDRVRWGGREPDFSDLALTDRYRASLVRRAAIERTPSERLHAILYDELVENKTSQIAPLVQALDISGETGEASRLLRAIHTDYPTQVAAGLLARLREGKTLVFGTDDILAAAGYALDDEDLVQRARTGAERDDLADAAASVLGPVGARALIEEILPVWRSLRDGSQPRDAAASERYNLLASRISHLPASSLIAAAEARSPHADSAELVILAKLLTRNREDNHERSRPFDAAARAAVQRLAANWGERLLQADDASRHDVSKVASLIEQAPDPSLLPLLERMLDDNLHRYAAILVEAAATGYRQSPLRDEASWPSTGEYFRAFLAIDAPETRQLMQRYLAEPNFGEDAARVLMAQWVRANERGSTTENFAHRHDFGHIAARRRRRDLDPAETTDDAEAIFAIVNVLIAEGATKEELRRAVRMATLGARLPHGERPSTFVRLLAVAQRKSRADLIAAMIQSGERVATSVVAAGIEETLEAATSDWSVLHDSNAWQLTEWLRLLPFTDDLGVALEAIRAVPAEHRGPRRLETVVSGLAITPTDGAEEALFGLAELEPDLYSDYMWKRAAVALRSERGVRLIVDFTEQRATDQRRSAVDDRQWAGELGQMLDEFPAVRQDVYGRLRNQRPTPGRIRLAEAIATSPDAEGLLLLLDLEVAWSRSLVGDRSVRDLVTERVPSPDWSNSFSIVPVAASALRARLLAQVRDGGPSDPWARALTAIDIARDDYGKPNDEPRHPDFASGKAWPILAPDPLASAD